MRNRVMLALVCLLLVVQTFAARVPFHVYTRSYTGTAARSHVLVYITGCVDGSGNAVPAQVPSYTPPEVVFSPHLYTADTTGTVQSTIVPTNDIVCAGLTGTTKYLIEVWAGNSSDPVCSASWSTSCKRKVFSDSYVVGSSGTFDLATATDASGLGAADPLLKNAAGDQTVIIQAGKILKFQGGTIDLSSTTCVGCGTGGGGGGVLSVAVGNLAPIFTASVANPTTTPSITFSLTAALANQVLAGPTNGSAAAPTYRSLVAADLPNLAESQITGLVADLAARALISGTPTINNCVKWISATTIGDAGAACGSGGGGFTNPMTTLGDVMYGAASGVATRIAGNTTTTRKFLRQTGDGTSSAAPAWDVLQAADVPTLNQNTTGTAANITGVAAIANGGTGQSTQQAAIDALLGAQSAGKYARSDGTHVTLQTIQAADVPTLNQNTTGTAGALTANAANCGANQYAQGVDASGAAEGCSQPAVGSLAAGTVPATSVLNLLEKQRIQAAVCQGSTASHSFDTFSSNAPVAACKSPATNTQMGVAQFTATGQHAQYRLHLGSDFTSLKSVAFQFYSEAAGGAGNVVWFFKYACVAAIGGANDPSLSASQTVSIAAQANNTTNRATLSTPTFTCTADQIAIVDFGLDSTTSSAGNQDLTSVTFQIQSAKVAQ